MLTEQHTIFLCLVFIVAGFFILLSQIFNRIQRRQHFDNFVGDKKEQQKKPFLDVILFAITRAFTSNEEEVFKKFYAAGFYHFKYAKYYIPLKYISLLGGLVGLYFIHQEQWLSANNVMIAFAIWLMICILAPDAFLASKAKALTRKISKQLPYLLDLMAVCVQTGMTIESSMSYLGKEMASFDKDLSHMLNKTTDRARIVGLDKALDELYATIISNEMRSFVMTLKQSLQYGTSIYHVLTTLAKDIREVQMLDIEEKIGQLSAKMSIPLVLFIMIPVVILITAPGIMRMMADV
ncbi:biotin synthase [Vibrio sp. 10N.286.49.B3]|uniref:type II secretion system F family protein n=1 Tax=Vibrio sp. 10N.286.49.B3 TaxID=1880855 RepID=UPI000C85FBC8|nr:type II secretion system F family protein [Vibrio sp. 10N.286.49.B3]PMH46704.1 biotin synthase [Vibrio sp. 10N.286.49.B3]